MPRVLVLVYKKILEEKLDALHIASSIELSRPFFLFIKTIILQKIE
jgi:hypothetical protein